MIFVSQWCQHWHRRERQGEDCHCLFSAGPETGVPHPGRPLSGNLIIGVMSASHHGPVVPVTVPFPNPGQEQVEPAGGEVRIRQLPESVRQVAPITGVGGVEPLTDSCTELELSSARWQNYIALGCVPLNQWAITSARRHAGTFASVARSPRHPAPRNSLSQRLCTACVLRRAHWRKRSRPARLKSLRPSNCAELPYRYPG